MSAPSLRASVSRFESPVIEIHTGKPAIASPTAPIVIGFCRADGPGIVSGFFAVSRGTSFVAPSRAPSRGPS